MTSFTLDGLKIDAQDLSGVSPDAGDHNRLFNHDGTSEIPMVGGGTESNAGFYLWDHDAKAWNPMRATVVDADTLDGLDSLDFVKADGSVSMTGALDAQAGATFGAGVTVTSGGIEIPNDANLNISGGDGNFRLGRRDGTSDTEITAWSGVHLRSESLGDDVLSADSSGNVSIPNGDLSLPTGKIDVWKTLNFTEQWGADIQLQGDTRVRLAPSLTSLTAPNASDGEVALHHNYLGSDVLVGDSTGDVRIPSGSLVPELGMETPGGFSVDELAFDKLGISMRPDGYYDMISLHCPGRSQDVLVAHGDGLVEVPNGDLTVQGVSLATEIDNHLADTANPHSVTAAQVGAVSLSGDSMTGDLAFGSPTNSNSSRGVATAGYIEFVNQEHTNIPVRSLGYDDSEGLIFNNHSGNPRNVVESLSPYQIQKNGTDGTGIINFKTA